jgi:predicted RNA-binding Zn-ribbon protein involved in translation (DUF1610 family)
MQHNIPDHKECPECGEIKSSSAFHRNAARRDGLTYVCADCIPIYESRQKKQKKNLSNIEKICNSCHRNLPSRMYLYDQNSDDRLRATCRTCSSYRDSTFPSLNEVISYEEKISLFINEASSRFDLERNRSEFEQFIWKRLLASGLLVKWRPPAWIHKTSIPD